MTRYSVWRNHSTVGESFDSLDAAARFAAEWTPRGEMHPHPDGAHIQIYAGSRLVLDFRTRPPCKVSA